MAFAADQEKRYWEFLKEIADPQTLAEAKREVEGNGLSEQRATRYLRREVEQDENRGQPALGEIIAAKLLAIGSSQIVPEQGALYLARALRRLSHVYKKDLAESGSSECSEYFESRLQKVREQRATLLAIRRNNPA